MSLLKWFEPFKKGHSFRISLYPQNYSLSLNRDCTVPYFLGGEPNIMYSAVMSNANYHKVLSINTSCLEAHFIIYKMFMMGEFNLYLLSLVT